MDDVWRYFNLSLITCITLFISGALAYPEGPPDTACVDMAPGVATGVVGPIGHLVQSQNILPTYGNSKTPPYYMLTCSEQYSPNQEIRVSIVANQTTGMVMYKGVLLQARKVICASDVGLANETIWVEDKPIGVFKSPGNNQPLKTMTCGGIEHSAACHSSPQFKINETMTWVAPSSGIGHVVFRATIVQEANIYWTDFHSKIILDASNPDGGAKTCGSNRAGGYGSLTIALTFAIYVLIQ